MPATTADLVEQVKQRLDAEFSPQQAEQLYRLLQQFCAFVADESALLQADAQDIYGALLGYWHLARHYSPEQTKVRVYNPQFEQDGWQSTHTIVSILIRDVPFLVDTVRMALTRLGLGVHIIAHPVLAMRRDAEGTLLNLEAGAGENQETLIHIEIDRQTESAALENIAAELRASLAELRVIVEDWQAMREHLAEIIEELGTQPPPTPELEEDRAFLRWLNEEHFTFIGCRDYVLQENADGELQLLTRPGSGLGLLRDEPDAAPRPSQSFAALPAAKRRLARAADLLVLTKANRRSRVHRDVYLDFIGIRQFNAAGQVIGERRFLGLYTAPFYHLSVTQIPLLRHKAKHIILAADFHLDSHRGKALLNVLETYPRDELLQIEPEPLLGNALGILQLRERQRVRLFVREDRYGRFVSCLVYVPRERYDSEIRKRMQAVLLDTFASSHIEFNVALSDAALGQVHFLVRTPEGDLQGYDLKQLEARIIDATREWPDHLYDALLAHNGEERGIRLFHLYAEAFPVAYREDFSARHAVYDIAQIEALERGELGLRLYHPVADSDEQLRFRLFHTRNYLPLSDVLPMLENMGVRVLSERAYELRLAEREPLWIQEFELLHTEQSELDLRELHEAFQHTFSRVWRGEIDNDGFNRLVLRARMDWRDIVIFRAYCKYLRQVDTRFSQVYMEQTLANNPAIARLLLGLFHARLNPRCRSASREVSLRQSLDEALDAVASLDEDRILRQFLHIILATLRTNYFQTDAAGAPKPYLSFKFDPQKVPNLPEPRPQFEIFVYSPQVEGVHLRGGKVARGGLRWSDRPEDFRTEILGLVKAQQVKNAVIVPVGSKGGFVAKRLPADGSREAIQTEAVACYQTFIRGLLDLTDNLVNGKIQAPADTLRHDDDDPYLVVAADKGTATFSDIANAIAAEYGFWLGDAFASGGAHGYDHKKMGITARGAWEAVKRHFRELGKDIQQQDFSVIGIGDMSGDVFGNGMLLSPRIRLLAAFNHQHIFIDPDPDPEASFAERERLFLLPRSTWMDYCRELISEGGGVYSRQAKSISLSPQARAALGINASALPPSELIRALLRAPVDLLWNGGIGTYVKASGERHAEVGDKTNDALRVNGRELRCKVVGEGGNLGFTQLGRIEYALSGGRINTDATDNVGGVDCSDHEVNIKILLNAVVAAEDMTPKQRNQLLEDMQEQVAQRVIQHNYRQTQELSLARLLAPQTLGLAARFIRDLEQQGKLDRDLEFLPDDSALQQREAARLGLTGPELAVLMAYGKITLYQALLDSDLPAEPHLDRLLRAYFPSPLPEQYADAVHGHRLRREIIANELTNRLVNQAGTLFAYTLREETGAPLADISRAYLIAWEVFQLEALWSRLEALDNQVPAGIQGQLMQEVRKLVERAARWLLRNSRLPLNSSERIAYFAPGVQALADMLPELLGDEHSPSRRARFQAIRGAGAPPELVDAVARLAPWLSALDIVEAAAATDTELSRVAGLYYELGERLQLHWLRERISALPRDNRWNALSRSALREDLYRTQRQLSIIILQRESRDGSKERLDAWLYENRLGIARVQQLLSELERIEQPDLAMLSVALREIKGLL